MNRKPIFRSSILMLIAFFALSLVVGAGTVEAQEGVSVPLAQTEPSQTVYEIIRDEADLASFEALVEAAALNDNLQEDGPFTVFAPTNDALAAFNATSLEDDVSVTDVLLYHVLNGEYMAADLAQEDAVMTLAGEYLFFDTADDGAASGLVLNGTVMVVRADIEASNGVVHIIDAVLPFPGENTDFATADPIDDTLLEDGTYDDLLSLLEGADVDEGIEIPGANHTVIVTTDEGFAKMNEDFATQR